MQWLLIGIAVCVIVVFYWGLTKGAGPEIKRCDEELNRLWNRNGMGHSE